MSLDIVLKRHNGTYHPRDVVAGYVKVNNKKPLIHQGIMLKAEGRAILQLSSKYLGIVEKFGSSLKHIVIFSSNVYLAEPGKLPVGVELPFEFEMRETEGRPLLESYRGVFINIQYYLSCEIGKGKLSRTLSNEMEFYVRIPRQVTPEKKPYLSVFTPSVLNESAKKGKGTEIPNFNISFRLDSTTIAINEFLKGVVKVFDCESRIKSIELKLMRIETLLYSGNAATEISEIQNIQIVDGDPCLDIDIPINIVLPNLYSCSTCASADFVLEFQLLFLIKFDQNKEFAQPIPVDLYRIARK